MTVLVVGSFTMDYTVETPRFPKTGETVLGKDYKTSLGGKGANQGMAARMLGSEVTMVGMVGRDAHGDTIIESFEKAGVDMTHVRRCETKSGLASIMIDPEGENRIVMVPGANYAYPPEALHGLRSAIGSADVVMAQLEMPIKVVETLGEICEALGKTFIVNPAPMHPLSNELLGRISILTPNETELASLVDRASLTTMDAVSEAAHTLLDKGVDHVVVTLGKKGALLVDASGTHHLQGYEVKAVDTVAAGDAFNGALAHSLARGDALEEAVRFANAAGALTVQAYGAINALPSKHAMDTFLNADNPKR